MKKLFKIGCGCLIALFVIILLAVLATIPSGKAKPAQSKESFRFPSAKPARWERRTADVTETSARQFLREYCKKNDLKNGLNLGKGTFCCISSGEFELRCPPSDQNFRLKHANLIRRAALKALLKNLTASAGWLNRSEPVVKETENEHEISSATELKLRNIVFKRYATARQTVSAKGNHTAVAESFSQSQVLFYQDKKLLEYTCDEHGEKWIMAPISVIVRGALSENDRYSMLMLFLNLLISEGLPVTFEYSAYSWDEEHKTGQVALLLVYDSKKGK